LLKYNINLNSGHSRLLGDADVDDGDILHPNSNHSTAPKSHQSPRLLYAQATGFSLFFFTQPNCLQLIICYLKR
jgi:hypothetical protein